MEEQQEPWSRMRLDNPMSATGSSPQLLLVWRARNANLALRYEVAGGLADVPAASEPDREPRGPTPPLSRATATATIATDKTRFPNRDIEIRNLGMPISNWRLSLCHPTTHCSRVSARQPRSDSGSQWHYVGGLILANDDPAVTVSLSLGGGVVGRRRPPRCCRARPARA